jgi:hypothetical protein
MLGTCHHHLGNFDDNTNHLSEMQVDLTVQTNRLCKGAVECNGSQHALRCETSPCRESRPFPSTAGSGFLWENFESNWTERNEVNSLPPRRKGSPSAGIAKRIVLGKNPNFTTKSQSQEKIMQIGTQGKIPCSNFQSTCTNDQRTVLHP